VKINPRNLLRHEIIGLRARVFDSSNPCQIGIEGLIVDETLKTILIETPRGRKRVLKEQVKLVLWLPDGTRVLVDGRELRGRPEDRLKKRVRYW